LTRLTNFSPRDPGGGSPTCSPEKRGDSKVLSLAPYGIKYESDFGSVHDCMFWSSPAQKT
jgi:hypothetical protein